MPEYRVVSGTYRTSEGVRKEPGDTVEIAEEVYDNHQQTFEPVEEEGSESPEGEGYEVETESPREEEQEESDGEESEEGEELAPSAEVPDDYSVLTKMAANYEGDGVHGAKSKAEIKEFFQSLSSTEVNALKRQAIEEIQEEG